MKEVQRDKTGHGVFVTRKVKSILWCPEFAPLKNLSLKEETFSLTTDLELWSYIYNMHF